MKSLPYQPMKKPFFSQIRPHLQQGKSIQVDIIGTSIHFADGTQIGLVSEQK